MSHRNHKYHLLWASRHCLAVSFGVILTAGCAVSAAPPAKSGSKPPLTLQALPAEVEKPQTPVAAPKREQPSYGSSGNSYGQSSGYGQSKPYTSPHGSSESPGSRLPSYAPVAAEPPDSREQVSALLKQGMEFSQKGRNAEAEGAFKKALSIDPKNGDANYNLGVIYEGKNQLEDALRYYKAAVSANPYDDSVREAMEQLQDTINQKRSAAEKAATEKQAQAQEALKMKQLKATADEALSAYKAKNYDVAIQKFGAVANSAPNDPDVQYALGQCWLAKGKSTEARFHLERAIKLNPNNPDYRKALAAVGSNPAISNNSPGGQPGGGPQGYQSPGYQPQDQGGYQPYRRETGGSPQANVPQGGYGRPKAYGSNSGQGYGQQQGGYQPPQQQYNPQGQYGAPTGYQTGYNPGGYGAQSQPYGGQQGGGYQQPYGGQYPSPTPDYAPSGNGYSQAPGRGSIDPMRLQRAVSQGARMLSPYIGGRAGQLLNSGVLQSIFGR